MSDGDGILPSVEETAERGAANRKKLIEDGVPLERAPDGQIESDDRPSGIVSEDEETGLIDPLTAR